MRKSYELNKPWIGRMRAIHFFKELTMKRFSSLAARTAAVVSLGLACALPASAQSSSTAGGTNSGPSVESRETNDNHRDFGWIGLLGLAGLLGLRRKHDHRDDPARRTDARRTTTSH
jgi:hypothetical protein